MSRPALQSDDFVLFGLPRRFGVDGAALDQRWRDLQREAHPDRFAAEGAAAQRLATQWSVRINEAYRRLRDPLRRAAYLCELSGAPIDAERNTAMPLDFLQEQMEWREALDEAGGAPEALESLSEQVARARRERLGELAELFDSGPAHDGTIPLERAQAAAQQVRALMFIDRFTQDVHQRLDALSP